MSDRYTLVVDLAGEEPLEVMLPLADDEMAIGMPRVDEPADGEASIGAPGADL
jgi:hypothetical protein